MLWGFVLGKKYKTILSLLLATSVTCSDHSIHDEVHSGQRQTERCVRLVSIVLCHRAANHSNSAKRQPPRSTKI